MYKTYKKRGISLILLVITIVVILILAAAIILTLTSNNPISEANKAKYVNDLASFVDDLNMYKAKMYAQTSGEFLPSSINATGEEMYTYIPSMQGKTIYTQDLKIESGELVYIGSDETRRTWAEIVNIFDKTIPENATLNVSTTGDKLNGTLTLADSGSGIDLTKSKYIITTQNIAYSNDATEWSTGIVFNVNPLTISVTKDDGDYYVQTLSVDKSGNKRVNVSSKVTVANNGITDPGYVTAKGVNGPVLKTGMTPIKWDGTTMVDTTISDTTWYDYSTKQWANARTEDGSMWVWIPRYEYQIPTPHTATAQTIAVNFVNGISTTTTSGYTMHPAFTFGTTELPGIWVAKFEAGGTTSSIDIKPNVSSLRNVGVNQIFTISRSMETNSKYGWGTTGIGIDTHLIKNIEWGAVAYLSSSVYGKSGEIAFDYSSSGLTGGGNYITNITQSTTGNIYGIYDMSGGSDNFVAAYVNNGNSSLISYGASLVNAEAKYKDVYISSGDTRAGNYAANSSKKGDAIYETSSAGTGYSVWYGDYGFMPENVHPFLIRGFNYSQGTWAGIFAFGEAYGYGDSKYSFRPVLLVGVGI